MLGLLPQPALTPTHAMPAHQEGFIPTFELAPCAFSVPAGGRVDCGYLSVLEDRANPTGRILRLHVAIFYSLRPDPQPDPVLFIDGGPGFSPLTIAPYVYERLYRPWLLSRNLILFDQRGAGYSEPLMGCPEVSANQERETITACRDSLNELELAHYNSPAIAADMEDLRRALGVEVWNLYGISYGSRVALTYMRDYPDAVRSAVLDSAYPPQVDVFSAFPLNLGRALEELFAACAADDDCATAYPDLEDVFYRHVEALTASPARVSTPDGEREISAYRFINYVFQALYDPARIPDLPGEIYNMEAGDYSPLLGLQSQPALNGDFSAGLYYTVQCQEEVPFSDITVWEANAVSYAPLSDFLTRSIVFGSPVYTICEWWDVPPLPASADEPVTSDIPTLILAGQFDPITPPEWGRLAGESLANSYVIEFPTLAHGVFPSHPCPQAVALAFLADPAIPPDAACVNEINSLKFGVG